MLPSQPNNQLYHFDQRSTLCLIKGVSLFLFSHHSCLRLYPLNNQLYHLRVIKRCQSFLVFCCVVHALYMCSRLMYYKYNYLSNTQRFVWLFLCIIYKAGRYPICIVRRSISSCAPDYSLCCNENQFAYCSQLDSAPDGMHPISLNGCLVC